MACSHVTPPGLVRVGRTLRSQAPSKPALCPRLSPSPSSEQPAPTWFSASHFSFPSGCGTPWSPRVSQRHPPGQWRRTACRCALRTAPGPQTLLECRISPLLDGQLRCLSCGFSVKHGRIYTPVETFSVLIMPRVSVSSPKQKTFAAAQILSECERTQATY